jgi:hypothetical protein
MDTINARISTNNDPALNVLMLTQGHPMVPSLGVINLTYSPYGTMLDQQAEILGSRGTLKIMHAGFYGVYGPAWAARADVKASLSDNGNTITMEVTNDSLKAGVQWGASHSFFISFITEAYDIVDWDGWWPKFGWKKNDDINFVIPLDFIQIVYYAIQIIQGMRDYIANQDLSPAEEKELEAKRQTFERIKARGGLTDTELEMIKPPSLPIAQIKPEQMLIPTLWGLVDEAGNTFNKSGWSLQYVFPLGVKNMHNGDYMQMKAYPGLVQAIDVYRLLVNWDKNTLQFGGSLFAFDQVIRTAHCNASLGVNVGVIFPFQLTLKNILFNNDVYGDLTFKSENSINTVTGTRKSPAPSMPTYNSKTLAKDIRGYFNFSTGLDFRFGIFLSFTFFSVISFSFSIDWDVLDDWFHLKWQLPDTGVEIGGNASTVAGATEQTADEVEVVFA